MSLPSCVENQDGLNVCRCLLRLVKSIAMPLLGHGFQDMGPQKKIVADNGNTFTAGLWTDLNRVLGIKVKFIPLYHQSTNGAFERQHRTIKDSLKASLIEMGDTHRANWMA